MKILRPTHWVKNLLIFAPLFFSGLWSTNGFLQLVWAFISFSLLASAVYIINDLSDIKQDRLHERTKQRPLASGRLDLKSAYILLSLLLLLSLSLAFFMAPGAILLLLIYLLINLLYSFHLKHIALLDVVLVASGYLIRIFVGAILLDIMVSKWMIIITFLLALFIALGKRKSHLNKVLQEQSRRSYEGYSHRFIEVSQALLSAIIIIAYIMYTINPEVSTRVDSSIMYITALPVVMGFLRYFQLQLVYNVEDDPVELVLRDPFLLVLISVWMVLFIFLIYIL